MDAPLSIRTAAVAAATTLALLAGCAQFAPGTWTPGTTLAEARSAWVQPSGVHPLPGGGTRLEYAQGGFGRQTWMVDFDAGGRLVGSRQVMTETDFATIVPGMTQDEVLFRLGRPAHVFPVGWQRQHVWNYRWFGGDCLWFQVAIDNASGRVVSAGTGQDPACDVATRD